MRNLNQSIMVLLHYIMLLYIILWYYGIIALYYGIIIILGFRLVNCLNILQIMSEIKH